jgi:hypothetical protein
MSKIYKTARGKSVDIDKVKLANETAVAVGNMRVNARGDAIGAGGKIAATRNQIMDKVYAVEEAPYSPNDPAVYQQQQEIMNSERARQLSELASNLTVPTESAATENSPQPAARGSLASSIAKTTQVDQKPLPKPSELKKAQGPSRI